MKYQLRFEQSDMYRSDNEIKSDARQWVQGKLAHLLEEVKTKGGLLKYKVDVDLFFMEIDIQNVSADLQDKIIEAIMQR